MYWRGFGVVVVLVLDARQNHPYEVNSHCTRRLEWCESRSLLLRHSVDGACIAKPKEGLFLDSFSHEVFNRQSTCGASANLMVDTAREVLSPTRATVAMIPSANAQGRRRSLSFVRDSNE